MSMLNALLGLLLLAPPVTEVASPPTDRQYDGQEAVAVPIAPEPAPEMIERPAPTPPPPAPLVASAVPEETGLAPTSPPMGTGPKPRWWGPYPRPKVIGFIGPMLQFTRLNSAFAATVGLGGGAWIRERFAVGGAVLWLLNPSDAGKTALGATQRLNVNFGGLTLALVVARTKALSFAIEGLIGGGGACLQNPRTGSCYARTAMFVGQPGIGLHVRLGPIIRLVLGFGYRLVAARDWAGPGNQQLGGPTGTVMLELGWF